MPLNLEDKTIKHWIECKDHCIVCGLYFNEEFREYKIFEILSVCRFCKKDLETRNFLYLGKYTENRKYALCKVIKKDGSLESMNSGALYDNYGISD